LLRQKMQAHYTIHFECYMLELYLDQLHDLLATQPKKLELREDP